MQAKIAAGGHEALGMWQTEKFDLIITDCNMPLMDGYSLARAIREAEGAVPPYPRTPIMAWTANALPNVIDQCRLAGIDDILSKPADLEKLRVMLEKWLPKNKINHKADSKIASSDNSQKSPNMEADNQTEDVLNQKILIEALGGNEKIAKELLIKFRDSLPARIARLEAALSTGDLGSAKNASHQLKGAAATMGAAPLSYICEQIELAAIAGDSAPLPALHIAFSRSVVKLAAELAKL